MIYFETSGGAAIYVCADKVTMVHTSPPTSYDLGRTRIVLGEKYATVSDSIEEAVAKIRQASTPKP